MSVIRCPNFLFIALFLLAVCFLGVAMVQAANVGDCVAGGAFNNRTDFICDPTAPCRPKTCFKDGLWKKYPNAIDIGECTAMKTKNCNECQNGALYCADGNGYNTLADCNAGKNSVATYAYAAGSPVCK